MTLLRGKPKRPGPRTGPLIRYGDDRYGWALQQADFLRAGHSNRLDFISLADEIVDVAGRDYDKLESALSRVVQHLLEWDHHPERRCRSWQLTIREHRRRIVRLLRKHPGLKHALAEVLMEAFEDARDRALDETGLPEAALPETCPYEWDDIVGREIAWPEAASVTAG